MGLSRQNMRSRVSASQGLPEDGWVTLTPLHIALNLSPTNVFIVLPNIPRLSSEDLDCERSLHLRQEIGYSYSADKALKVPNRGGLLVFVLIAAY